MCLFASFHIVDELRIIPSIFTYVGELLGTYAQASAAAIKGNTHRTAKVYYILLVRKYQMQICASVTFGEA